MTRQVDVRLVVIILLMMGGASVVVAAVEALSPNEVGRTGGGADTHLFNDEAHKMRWITREIAQNPEPSPLAYLAFVVAAVLVPLFGVVFVYRRRRRAPAM